MTQRICKSMGRMALVAAFLAMCFGAFGAQTNLIYGYAGNYGLALQSNVVVKATLLYPNPRLDTQTGIMVRQDPVTYTTLANGAFYFTNFLWGKYYLELSGLRGTVFTFWVGTNTTGTVSIGTLATNSAAIPPDPATNYYTMDQVDGLLTEMGVRVAASASIDTSTNDNVVTPSLSLASTNWVLTSSTNAAAAATNKLDTDLRVDLAQTNQLTAGVTNWVLTSGTNAATTATNGLATIAHTGDAIDLTGILADARLSTNVMVGTPGTAEFWSPEIHYDVSQGSNNNYALRVTQVMDGGSTNYAAALLGETDTDTSTNHFHHLRGVYGYAKSYAQPPGDVDLLSSFHGYTAQAGGALVDEMGGLVYQPVLTGTGNVGSAYGLWPVTAVRTGGGALSNYIALYIPTSLGASNNWSIYNLATNVKMRHDGDIGIGVSPSLGRLDIQATGTNTIPVAVRKQTGAGMLYIREGAQGQGWLTAYDGAGSVKVSLDASGNSYFAGAGAMGLGLTSPLAGLHTTNILGISQALRVDTAGIASALVVSNGGTVGVASNFIASGIGIGVSPSFGLLDVQASGTNTIPAAFRKESGAAMLYVREGAQGQGWITAYDGAGAVKISLDASGNSYLAGVGAVGFGLTSPLAGVHSTNVLNLTEAVRVDTAGAARSFVVSNSGSILVASNLYLGAGIVGTPSLNAVNATNVQGTNVILSGIGLLGRYDTGSGPGGLATVGDGLVYTNGVLAATGDGGITAETATNAAITVVGNATNGLATVAHTGNAADLTGTLADARLSSNVPLKDTTNTFTAEQTYGGGIRVTNMDVYGTLTADAFAGPADGLTSLQSTQLVGTIPDARLSTNVSLLGAAISTNEIDATFYGWVEAQSAEGVSASTATNIAAYQSQIATNKLDTDLRSALAQTNQLNIGTNQMSAAAHEAYIGGGIDAETATNAAVTVAGNATNGLATIAHTGNAIDLNGTVFWNLSFNSPLYAGLKLNSLTTAERDALEDEAAGHTFLNTDSNVVQTATGSEAWKTWMAWEDYTPPATPGITSVLAVEGDADGYDLTNLTTLTATSLGGGGEGVSNVTALAVSNDVTNQWRADATNAAITKISEYNEGLATVAATGDAVDLIGGPLPGGITVYSSNLSGTLPDAVFPAVLPAVNGSNLTGIVATTTNVPEIITGDHTVNGNVWQWGSTTNNEVGGTVTNRFWSQETTEYMDMYAYNGQVHIDSSLVLAPGQHFHGIGESLTNLNASNISSGTLAAARLPTIPPEKLDYTYLGQFTNCGAFLILPYGTNSTTRYSFLIVTNAVDDWSAAP